MFGMTEIDTGFGKESRSITLTIGVLTLIVCVAFIQWIVGALGTRSTKRSLTDEDV